MNTQRARSLRKRMTPPEVRLWTRLRELRALGWRFRRQSPEAGYILDFVCRTAKLVVEVDGVHHAQAAQSLHDARRDAALRERGFRVLRFGAIDVERETDGVVDAILNALASSHPTRRPALTLRTTPSPKGEGGRRYHRLVRLGVRTNQIAGGN
jgi:very-short-patch-repair endonuclease